MDKIRRSRGIIGSSIIGIVLNAFLATLKIVLGIIIASSSILSDGLNNLTDSLGAIITIVGTKLSMKRPTKKHPFGFGRFEYITSTIIGIIVIVVGVSAIRESISSIIEYYSTGVMASFSYVTLILIGVAILVKAIIAIVYIIGSKRFKSLSLKGSAKDSFFDILLSVATLIAALVGILWNFYIEGYIGIIIGIFIIKSGIEIVIEAMGHLIGNRTEEELSKSIKQDIASLKDVKGVYDLILNNYGNNKYIGSVHVGIPSRKSAHEVQEIERSIQNLMYSKYGIIMTVGIYVDNVETELSNKIRARIFELIKDNKNILQLHGFYVDEKDHYVNFDLVFSFDERKPNEFVSKAKETLEKEFSSFAFIINIDYDYA